jgi:hypothetical protein
MLTRHPDIQILSSSSSSSSSSSRNQTGPPQSPTFTFANS